MKKIAILVSSILLTLGFVLSTSAFGGNTGMSSNFWKLAGTVISPANDSHSISVGDMVVTGSVTGALDMGNDVITNIGNEGTDFDSSGGLTVAGGLTLGNYATKPTCDGTHLGMMVFDTVNDRPYVCASSDTWKPLDSDYDKDGITQDIDTDDTDANDATAAITDVKNGKTFYAGGEARTGTFLQNLFNGSATSGDYPQNVGGVDDYNAGGSRPSDSYAGSWTTCDAGNSYCQTSDATNADKKDDSADLVWSKWLETGDTKTWFWANNCEYPNGLGDGTCDTDGEAACKCVKKTSAETGCEAVGDGNWRLPYQKELMQAYINGSWGNLSSAGNGYWSATTKSNATHDAWITHLNDGGTYGTTKTNAASYRVRCVR